MDIQINKIKLGKSDRPEIYIERFHNAACEESKVIGDAADEVLTEAMQSLLSSMAETCFLSEDWESDGRVTGITFKHGDNGTGVVISGQMKVTHGEGAYVVNINTPYLQPDLIGPSEEMTIKRIQKAARDYLDSLPQQGDLFEQSA